MNHPYIPVSPWNRRNLLKALGIGAVGLGLPPALSACGIGTGSSSSADTANGANEVTGAFDWKKAKGATIKHPADPAPVPAELRAAAPGVHRAHRHHGEADLVPEADYFTKLNTELAGGSGAHDVFMTGAYFIWTVRPARMDGGPQPVAEELRRDQRRTTTSRTSTRACAPPPAGTSRPAARWAPAASGPSRGASRPTSSPTTRSTSTRRASSPPRRFDDFIQLAIDLTDRSAEPLRHRVPRLEVVGDDPPRVHDPVHPRGRHGLHGRRLRATPPR